MPGAVEYDMVPDITYVVYRECTPSWRIYEQEFGASDLTFVIKGNARYTIDGTPYNLQEGDLLYLSPGSIRAGITYPNKLMHCFSVNFNLHDSRNRSIQLPFSVVNHIGAKDDIIHLLHELSNVWLEKQPGDAIKIRGLFLLVLHRFLELIVYNKDSTAMDFRVAKVTRYLAAHYAERISVRKMADMVGLNTHYFGTLFHQETGLSLNRYLIRTRVRKAENLLTSGEYKVGDAAEVCGFTDATHFYKQFKEIMGYAPSTCIPKKTGRGNAAAAADEDEDGYLDRI
jgi:AraC-like DNA-binding protein